MSTLLLLGIVGWSAGWVAAGSEIERQGQIDPTTTTQAPKPPTSSPTPSRPAASPTPVTPTVTSSREGQFDMPDLVGKDFRVARLEARAKKLGVNVVFNERSLRANGTVVSTNPVSGILVFPGVTITLRVAGPPPRVFVPDIVGKPCGEGRDAVLEAGLRIKEYPSGEKGNVTKVEPAPGAPALWNDEVRIFCG